MKNYTLNPESVRLEVIILLLFYVAVAMSVLYLVQTYSAFPFRSDYRLIIYVLLYIMALGLSRKLTDVPLAFWALGVAVAWCGVHTYLLSDAELAIHATSRFVNVMALAPLAGVLLLHSKQLEKVFQIFFVVCLIAMASLLYQYWGGNLNRLVQGYVAIRGDLIRFMTLVGEPNVGGMLGSLIFVMGITLSKRRLIGVLWGSLAVALVIFSLSKAALLGLGIGLLIGSLFYGPNERQEALFRITASGAMGLGLMWIIGADDYIRVIVDSVLGDIRGEPSAFEDFQFRQGSLYSYSTPIKLYIPQWVSYFLGTSFLNVGSAAQEIRGLDVGVILHHNSYSELFLTGGLLLLGLVLFLMVRAGYTLFKSRGTGSWPTDRCALICLTMLSAWMLVYPVIYEPVTGCLLWIIVGYGNRPCQPLEAGMALHSR